MKSFLRAFALSSVAVGLSTSSFAGEQIITNDLNITVKVPETERIDMTLTAEKISEVPLLNKVFILHPKLVVDGGKTLFGQTEFNVGIGNAGDTCNLFNYSDEGASKSVGEGGFSGVYYFYRSSTNAWVLDFVKKDDKTYYDHLECSLKQK